MIYSGAIIITSKEKKEKIREILYFGYLHFLCSVSFWMAGVDALPAKERKITWEYKIRATTV